MTPTDEEEAILGRTSQIVRIHFVPSRRAPFVLCNICWAQPKNVAVLVAATSCLVSFALLLFAVIYYFSLPFAKRSKESNILSIPSTDPCQKGAL